MFRILLLIFAFTALTSVNVYAGIPINETDTGDYTLVGFFDLRDRESYIQITNTSAAAHVVHIQVFNVGNLCNENDFFDAYTGNDTHVYNLRDILTNDGNPAGFILPSDAYGIFVATTISEGNQRSLIGNLSIQDNNGYEYRTNLNGNGERAEDDGTDIYTFNYNSEAGVVLSDIVGVMLSDVDQDEVLAADIANIWVNLDVDIFDLNEVPFSCRNVVYSCTESDGPLVETLLENVSDFCDECSSSVASFEYGINEAIPSSKGAPLLCPNNVISNGFVRLNVLDYDRGEGDRHSFTLFTGLNNGNGRGSIDVLWQNSTFAEFPGED